MMTFNTLADLNVYKKNPLHVKFSALCKSIRDERAAVDYEI